MYQRVCAVDRVEFVWTKFVRTCALLCTASLIKDAALIVQYTFLNNESIGDDAWKGSVLTMNFLVVSAVTMVLIAFWGSQIIHKIYKSQLFRNANVGKKDQNQIMLVKWVAWMLFTSIARVGVSVMRMAKTGDKYMFLTCMHSLDYIEGLDKCEQLKKGANWQYVTDMPLISIALSLTDLIYSYSAFEMLPWKIANSLKSCFVSD